MKEDVRYILADYSDFHINANLYLNDCDELELEDSSILNEYKFNRKCFRPRFFQS